MGIRNNRAQDAIAKQTRPVSFAPIARGNFWAVRHYRHLRRRGFIAGELVNKTDTKTKTMELKAKHLWLALTLAFFGNVSPARADIENLDYEFFSDVYANLHWNNVVEAPIGHHNYSRGAPPAAFTTWNDRGTDTGTIGPFDANTYFTASGSVSAHTEMSPLRIGGAATTAAITVTGMADCNAAVDLRYHFKLSSPHGFQFIGRVGRTGERSTAWVEFYGPPSYVINYLADSRDVTNNVAVHGTLPAGDYHIMCKTFGFFDSAQASFDLQLTATPDQPSGFSESASLPPTETISNPTPLYRFKGVASPAWVSVPTTVGLEFTMKDGGLFTDILAFPSGASGTYSITDGDRVLGAAGPGGSFRLGTPDVTGVSRFQIRGIKPSDGARFALQLAFNNPSGDFEVTPIRAAPLKVVLATDPSNSQVIRLNLATGAREGPFTSGMALRIPFDMVEGPDHDIYVLDANFSGTPNLVLRFDGATGRYKKTVASTPGNTGTSSLSFGPDGSLYVLISAQDIYKYDPQTGAELQHTVATTVPPYAFYSIAFGPDGLLYVSGADDRARGVILKYSATGSPLGLFAYAGDGNGPRKPVWRGGKLFVPNLNDGTVLSFDAASGQSFGVFSDPPSNGHYALALTPENNFLVSSGFNENVTEISGADGSVIRVFAENLKANALVLHELAALPEITAQPQGGAFPPNTPVTLSVTATGGPLAYQWKKDDAVLPGETASTLSIATLQTGGAGSYRVVVSNSTGSITSDPAVVTIKDPVCVPVPSGLVAWFPFDGDILDMTRTVTATSATGQTFEPAIVGGGIRLGAVGALDLGRPAAIETERFTWSVWVRLDGPGPREDGAVILGKYTDGGTGYDIAWYSGLHKFRAFAVDEGLTGPSTQAYGVTYHLALSYDGERFSFYINGKLEATKPFAGPINYAGYPWVIGNNVADFRGGEFPRLFDGLIDDLAIFNRALSGAEVEAIYNAAGAGMCRPVLPVITSQPVQQTVSPGGPVTLSIGSTGEALAYQWRRNGKPIPGATAASYTVAKAGGENAGSYDVVVTGRDGSVTSAAASVFVLDLQMFAGLVIDGPVGGQVRVEYTNDIQQQTGWTALNTLTLPRSPYVYIDENSPGQPKRFYRAVPVQ